MVASAVAIGVLAPIAFSRGDDSAAAESVEPPAITSAAPTTTGAPPTTPVVTRPASIASVVALGDSLTDGQGASDPETTDYIALTEAALPDTDWSVNAVRGATHDVVFDGTDLPKAADAAVVELGTNDWNTKPAEQFGVEYSQRVAALRASYPGALIVCVGVWQPPNQRTTVDYDRVIRSACEQVNGQFVLISDLFPAPANHQLDENGFHPGDAGYRAIADRVLAAFGV